MISKLGSTKYGIALALVLLFVAVVTLACGSSDAGQEAEVADAIDETSVNAIGERLEISAWTRPNSEFTYEQFVDAGWKQYEIYDVDTLPLALDARYGFFNRRDVEIRRYETHDHAMDAGVTSASEAIDRIVHDGSGFTSRRVYGGYIVVGNLVMMCELSTDDCIGLVEAVEEMPEG